MGGERIGYDALVAATGVWPRRLPGTAGVRGAHYLRTLGDALALKERLAAGRRVVVGAGFIGAEAAAAARGVGAHVPMVEPAPVPLARAVGSVPYFWSDQYDLKIQGYGHVHGHEEVDGDPR